VVDERNGWRIIHPSFRCLQGVVVNLVFVIPALGALAVGIYELAKYGNAAGFFVGCCIGAACLGGMYFPMFQYFVAMNEQQVAHGYRRGAPRQVVGRAAISRATWGGPYRNTAGRLLDEDGKVLMKFEYQFSRRQTADLARELGVPFRG
jgi:hypothetical protein